MNLPDNYDEYARVTSIIKEVLGLPPGLVDWIRKTERAGISTKKILDDAAVKGTRIHDYISKKVSGKKARIQKRYKPRVEILLDYLKDKKNIQTEVPLKCDVPIKHQGHLDYVYSDLKTAGVIVADLKTGRPREEHELQLQGYGYLLEQNKGNPPGGLELLYLYPSYLDIVQVKYNKELWLSLITLYEWKRKNSLG